MTDRQAVIDVLPLYALGDVTTEELVLIEQALAEDPSGREELRALTEAAHQLALLAPTAAPPPNGFDKVIQRIDSEDEKGEPSARSGSVVVPMPTGPRRGGSKALPVALAAAVAGTLVLGAMLFREVRTRQVLQRALDGSVAQIGQSTRERAELARQLEELRAQLQDARGSEVVRILQAPDLRVSLLGPRDGSVPGVVRVLWRPSEAAWLIVGSGLGPVPLDKDLQLWGLRGGQPTSGGVLPVGPDGTVRVRVPLQGTLGESDSAAITLEPKGGLPAPSGPTLFAGTI